MNALSFTSTCLQNGPADVKLTYLKQIDQLNSFGVIQRMLITDQPTSKHYNISFNKKL